jgi:prepilin-type N-terminal cleavage/methylation domain-containing protein
MRTHRKSHQSGFSLLELTITILVLVVVMGAVFSQIDRITKTSTREALTTDLVQQNRDFVDLFVRDVHMTGYPQPQMYAIAPTPACTPTPLCDKSIAVGIVSASPTSLRLEGDIYGDGNVYSVLYTYYQVDPNNPPDPNCPCLRRSAVLKISGDPIGGQSPAQYYTEVQNIIDPTGMVQGIFTYFDAAGTQINVGTGVDFETGGGTIQQIDAIKVNLNVRSVQRDPQTGQQVVNSLASIAELEN